MKKFSAARLLGKKTAGIAMAGAVALAFAPAIPAQAADDGYTYLYAALSYTDYYANEGVVNGASDEAVATADSNGEYDLGAYDAVSRATTNHGLHRGNYQGDVTVYDTEGNSYELDHWVDKGNIMLTDGTTIGLSKGTITKADGTTATMPTDKAAANVTPGYKVTGIKYVPVAVKTSELADFKAKYRTVDNGGTLAGGYSEGNLESYSETAAVDTNTNGLKVATKNADGSFSFGARQTGSGSGIADAAQKNVTDLANAAGQSVNDYLGVAVQPMSSYGDFIRVDLKSNYGDLGANMQAVKWEYYGTGDSTTPLATFGTKFAADNWMHRVNGIQLGLSNSKRAELPAGTSGAGKWKITVCALGYADTSFEVNIGVDDLHGELVKATQADLDEFAGVIAKAQAVQEPDVTAESWTTLQAELEEALKNQAAANEAFKTDDGIAQAYVYAYRDDLQGALDNLVYVQKAQNLKVTTKTASVKASALKKKAKSCKLITVKGAQTGVSYAKKSGSPKLSVNKKNGKVTVKKGTKKGTYRAKVTVRAAAATQWQAASKTVTVTVKVR